MSFFEDVINTTKSAAATAGKKTDEAVRFTKLKIKESQTTGDIKAHFEKLGQMAYEMQKSENPDSNLFDAEVEEIDKLYEKLSEINLLLDDLRQEVTCTECGAKTKSDNSFCPKCGAKLPEKAVPKADEEVILSEDVVAKPEEEEKKDEENK
mgnify:FL=1